MIQNSFAVPTLIDIPALFSNIDFDTAFTYINDEGQELPLFPHIERDKTAYLGHHRDKYNYVIHKIIEAKVFNKDLHTLNYVPLKYEYLEKMLGARYTDEVLTILRKLGIIQRDSHYIKGLKSYGYRIHPTYESQIVLRDVYKAEVWDNKLAKQKALYRAKVNKSITMEWKNLSQLKIKEIEAKAFIQQKEKDSHSLLAFYKPLLEQFSSKDLKQFKIAFKAAAVENNNYESTLSFTYNNIQYSYQRAIQASENNKEYIQYNITYLYNNNSYFYVINRNSISPSALYWHRLYHILHSIKLSFSLYKDIYFLMNIQEIKKALTLKRNKVITAYQLLNTSINNQYNTDLISINKIANEDWFIEQPDKESRIYTNLSNLSTNLRNFLYHTEHNQTLVNLDICNSQPYIFSLLLIKEYRGADIPDDIKQYIELTASGKFYERVMVLMGMKPEEIDDIKRKEFKVEFFGKIFFCTAHYSKRTREGMVFAEHFKNVYQLINNYKEENYKRLAIEMQRAEAKIILKDIGSKLMHEKIWFSTIHDSVVVLAEHKEYVKTLIRASFQQSIGIAPTIKADELIVKI